jgi:serine/threonine-protein kinase ULK4
MNNYSLTEEIGKGKYSVVYKGRKKNSIEYYAIKGVEKLNRHKVMNEVGLEISWRWNKN